MIPDRLLARITQIPGFRTLWNRFPAGSLSTRVRYGIFDRPHYAYGVYAAADLAKRLGLSAIEVAEFGVAGGRGLLALENISAMVSADAGVLIHISGFDSGDGMPAPVDYRDLPHVWGQGFYRMDSQKLKERLKRDTSLILGDMRTTVTSWTPRAPIGFVAFDLDYYSSTKGALQLFEFGPQARLPRVYCHFDDIMWPEYALHNEWVGELCAIREFNKEHPKKKLCPIHMLRHMRPHQETWNDQMYVLHDFEHPLYSQLITGAGEKHTQIPL
jgi:hypothetical protein